MPNYSADAFDTIRARMAEIKTQTVEMCPSAPAVRTLHACLRSVSPCAQNCPFFNDWIGPEKA